MIIVKKFNNLSGEKPTSGLRIAHTKTVASRFHRLESKIKEQQIIIMITAPELVSHEISCRPF